MSRCCTWSRPSWRRGEPSSVKAKRVNNEDKDVGKRTETLLVKPLKRTAQSSGPATAQKKNSLSVRTVQGLGKLGALIDPWIAALSLGNTRDGDKWAMCYF